jgi:hypothetical protein
MTVELRFSQKHKLSHYFFTQEVPISKGSKFKTGGRGLLRYHKLDLNTAIFSKVMTGLPGRTRPGGV